MLCLCIKMQLKKKGNILFDWDPKRRGGVMVWRSLTEITACCLHGTETGSGSSHYSIINSLPPTTYHCPWSLGCLIKFWITKTLNTEILYSAVPGHRFPFDYWTTFTHVGLVFLSEKTSVFIRFTRGALVRFTRGSLSCFSSTIHISHCLAMFLLFVSYVKVKRVFEDEKCGLFSKRCHSINVIPVENENRTCTCYENQIFF